MHDSPLLTIRCRHGRTRTVIAFLAAAVIAGGEITRARAEELNGGDCRVNVAQEDVPVAWRSAVAAIRARLRDAGGDADCRAVAIVVEHDGALVFLTTRDGRQALRRLDSPDELAPVLDALLVTLPPRKASSGLSALSRLSNGPPSSIPAHLERRPLPLGSASSAVFFALTAGGRLSAPSGFASPSFSVRAGAVVGSWELAAFGQWDPAHVLLDGAAPPEFSMSRYDAGVFVGRRVPAGETSLAFGATTSVALISESGAEDAFAEEPLIGAYAAVLWPARARIRGRAELSADGAVTRVGRPLRIDSSLPPLPWWSAAASAGVEWEVP